MSATVVALAAALSITAQVRRTPVVEVVEKAGPTVVNIGAEIVDKRNPFRRLSPSDGIWRDFFRRPKQRRQRRSESLGSGVIIDGTGLVLTNEHVVARASAITVTLSDRRAFEADVVGADPRFDVAVLRLRDAKDIPVAFIGTAEDLMPGEPAVAIGNPFGLSNTVTTGVISALHRSIKAGDRTYEDFIQTDAAINPGNSGGALFNIEGKLIGVNTAIHGGGEGIGFAIPIDKAMAVVEEVLRYGEVRPIFLGLTIDPKAGVGAVVDAITSDGPAAKAGLRAGDRIVDMGGQEIEDARAFRKVARALVTGQEVAVRFVRRGQVGTTTLVVREMTFERAEGQGQKRLGIAVTANRGRLVIKRVAKGTDASAVGIRPGDLLLSVAGRTLRSEGDFKAICAAIREAEAVAVIIGRGKRRYYVTLRLR